MNTAGFLIGLGVGTALAGMVWTLAYYAARPAATRAIGPYVAAEIRKDQRLGPILVALQAPGINEAFGAGLSNWANDFLP